MNTPQRNPHNRIKMVTFDKVARRMVEVHPDNGVSILDMAAMFEGEDGQFYSVPGFSAAWVYAEWLEQQRRGK